MWNEVQSQNRSDLGETVSCYTSKYKYMQTPDANVAKSTFNLSPIQHNS